MIDKNIIKQSIQCGCPKCGTPSVFPHKLTLDVIEKCPVCGLDVKSQDSGDGPAVFLIFILGFLLTPLALVLEYYYSIPLWVHAILWTVVSIGLCILTMQPLKAYVMALNYKHRGGAHGV